MKNYKKIVPLALVVLMILSCYKLIADAKVLETEYMEYIEVARGKKAEGIYVESFKLYKKAFDMKNSLGLADEISEVISLQDNDRDKVAWGKYMMEKYPTDSNGYEYLMENYALEKNYANCFEIYEEAKKRMALSDRMNVLRKGMEYEYTCCFEAYGNVGTYGNDYCAVEKDGLWGYVNETGKLAIPLKFQEAGVFGTELAPVKGTGGDIYFIDKGGNKTMVVPKQTQEGKAGFFDNNIYALSDGTKYRYYDRNGKMLLESFDLATTFNYNVAAVKQAEDWYFISNTGAKINEEKYREVALDEKQIAFRNERAFAQKDEGYIMIDLNGKQVSKQLYDDARPFLDNTYAAVKIGEKWGFVDKTGKILIEPKFEEAESFSNGFAAAKENNFWGYIDTKGNFVIKPSFEEAKAFTKNECSFIKTNEKWVLLKLLRSNY